MKEVESWDIREAYSCQRWSCTCNATQEWKIIFGNGSTTSVTIGTSVKRGTTSCSKRITALAENALKDQIIDENDTLQVE